MLSLKTGNILDTDARAIVIPVNAVGEPGAGLAKAAATRWPAWAKLYKQACADSELEQAGDITLHRNPDPGPEWVISVATKGHWSEKSTIPAIVTALKTLAKMVRDHRFESLALPALGCGLGGLSWNDVHVLIQEYLELSPCDIHIYPPVSGECRLPAASGTANRKEPGT